MKRLAFLVPVVLLIAAACGSDSDSEDSDPAASDGAASETISISGSLTYPQRIALLPDGTATVTLEDISIADIAAPVVAEQTIELGDQQVPIAFELEVDTDDLEAPNTYAVRASIVGPDGELAWTTDTANIVETDGGDVDVGELGLVQVEAGDTAETDAAGSVAEEAGVLIGLWNVIDIDGEPVLDSAVPTLEFASDGSLSGSTGCNTYRTGFSVDGEALVLEPIAVTMMACEPDVSEQEATFLAVLDDEPTFGLVDASSLLTLENSSGSTLSARR